MSPSALVSSSGGRQGLRCKKPRLVLKTINVIIEDEVNENEEVTLWDDAVNQEQSSKDVYKSTTLFKSCMKGENSDDEEEEATGRRQIMPLNSGRILTTSSTGALCSISNLQQAQHHHLLVGGNSQLLPRSNSTTIINNHPNYQLMPMPGGCATSGTGHLNMNKRPQAAAKRIFWGEEVPLMAVPVLSSKSAAVTTAQLHPLSKSMGKDTDVSYSMTAGHSLLITIKPVKGGNAGAGSDENSASASHQLLQRQPRRLLELSSLLNFFQLLVPEGVGESDDNDSISCLSYLDNQKVQKLLFSKSPYFFTLLDPSMPRLTNCGYYYRMRYAVYVMVSTTSVTAPPFSAPQKFAEHQISDHNWRSSSNNSNSKSLQPLGAPFQLKVCPSAPAQGAFSHLVLHIGELHVYTIFPKEGGGGKGGKSSNKDANCQYFPKWCQPGHIHYENVSFFANTAPLNDEELAALQPATAGSISTMVSNFRRTLKLLNSVVINPADGVIHLEQQSQPQLVEPDECYQHSFESTLLLEQLKYPKCCAEFTNTDRTAQQFVRNQVEMFSRYQAFYSSAANRHTAVDLSNRMQESLMKIYSVVAALPVEKKLLPVTLTVNNNGNGNKEAKNDVDWSTVDDFLSKLHWLRNQATKSKRIRSKSVADSQR